MCYYPTRCRFHRAASPSGKNALPHCTAGHKLAAVASPRYHTDCRDMAGCPVRERSMHSHPTRGGHVCLGSKQTFRPCFVEAAGPGAGCSDQRGPALPGEAAPHQAERRRSERCRHRRRHVAAAAAACRSRVDGSSDAPTPDPWT